ncbi:aromatic acid/H+ symport family MFS transporter [Leucobacter coleopterorum]|uniref:Aromatic acid/H+ symport family MFS transporter n=1 Tax=Leucobacter coleopterorum TaxID=2714933 RepID=A0ABX6JY43_9MICO|nr:aromatic acid/H+ symport family MFS transporter [Leucobacter coleopterorum]QIM17759.1 aromatic acid/H+ symport family MFS transporter [Leucobacter coleopterorum]
MNQSTKTARGLSWPVVLCWITIMLDGFDLVVLGTVIPTLNGTGELGFNPAASTFVATIGLVGVGLGAILIGPIADSRGRRMPLLVCVALFSVATLAIAWSPNVAMFGTFRFIAGLGLGACLPTVLAYMSEFTPAERSGRGTTLTMTGYHVGAVLTALLALVVIPDWRMMFVIGGVAGLIVLPIIALKLPESESFLLARERAAAGHEDPPAASTATKTLLRGPYALISIGICVASFMGLLLVYGLNTWLPEIMRKAGYDLGQGLTLLLLLNVGAVVGLILAGSLADRNGTKKITLVWFGLAAVFLAALSIRLDGMLLVYIAVFIAGVFVFSAQVLVYAYVSQLYPVQAKGTALGMAAGVGRAGAISGPFILGTLVTAGIAYPWGFYAFSADAVIAVIAIAFLPKNSLAIEAKSEAPAKVRPETQEPAESTV